VKKRQTYADLLRIMARLRAPGGCPWDRDQTHASLIKYLREEAGEVEQAIRKKDADNLCEELGDLLLQIVFHAQIAWEKGQFDMAEVVDALCRKMVRRHPHVFGQKRLKDAAAVVASWQEIKREEKEGRRRDLERKRLTAKGRVR
jgi:tetrapyrrole methylase family protein / MazG family protein